MSPDDLPWLEAKGWVAGPWELSNKGKRVRCYRLTARGRKQLASEKSKWETFARAVGLILNPVDQEAQ
jgi:DNA-binding PadR family transcriptional regulator